MRNILISVIIFLGISNIIFAQHEKVLNHEYVDGIYLNYSDFKNGRLTQPVDNQHKDDKIKLNQFYTSSEITFKEQHNESVFSKDSIFAIHLSNGENYRFIDLNPCLIADTTYLYIYVYNTVIEEYKMSGPHRRLIKTTVTYYFFSFGDHKQVFKLTLDNLRKYVLTETEMYKVFNEKMSTDEMLYVFNPYNQRFDVNTTLLSIMNQ